MKTFFAQIHGYKNGTYTGSFNESFASLDDVRVWAKRLGNTGDVLEIRTATGSHRRITI